MGRKATSGMMLIVLLTGMLALAFSIPQAKASGAPITGWSQTYGGTGSDAAYSVVQTSDGGYAIAGKTETFVTGVPDAWLVKTDSFGNMEWNKTYGGISNDYACSVIQTNDGGYALAGRTVSFGAGAWDFWLVKTDVSGNVEWNETYGGTDYDYACSLIQTSDGGYALAGETDSFGAGGADAWLVKTNESGDIPEFPSAIILPILIILSLISAVFIKLKKKKQ